MRWLGDCLLPVLLGLTLGILLALFIFGRP
jgi:hypothetical protein